MREVNVSEAVYQALWARATSFDDTADKVIARLLGIDKDEKQGDSNYRTPGGRLKKGLLLPQGEYELPILEALDELGGSAPMSEVAQGVERRLKDRFNEFDLALMKDGTVRWVNRMQFARLDLRNKGDLKKDSPRGIWELTDQGRHRLEESRKT
jgi:hypothetical protein